MKGGLFDEIDMRDRSTPRGFRIAGGDCRMDRAVLGKQHVCPFYPSDSADDLTRVDLRVTRAPT